MPRDDQQSGVPRISWTVSSSGHRRACADVQAHTRQSRPRHVRAHQGAERDVSRPGAVPRARDRAQRLLEWSVAASQGIFGAPSVFLDLREAGETCSKHRVARLMRENRLRALHGYSTRRWSVGKPDDEPTESGLGHGHHVRPDVARVAVPGCRSRSLLAQGSRLSRSSHHPSGAWCSTPC